MMMFDSRLFTDEALRRMAELGDDIANAATEFNDHLAEVERTADLPGPGGADAQQTARQAAWSTLGDLLVGADQLRALRDSLVDGTADPGRGRRRR
jgi:hypothetical protein